MRIKCYGALKTYITYDGNPVCILEKDHYVYINTGKVCTDGGYNILVKSNGSTHKESCTNSREMGFVIMPDLITFRVDS